MSGTGKQACLGSNSARNIGDMEDVVANILSRLTVKDIRDSMLVSKLWHRIINEPYFAQLHFNRSRGEQKYIMYLDNQEPGHGKKFYLMDKTRKISPYVTLPILDWYSSFRLICAFNGLLCFTISLGATDSEIFICNPATRDIVRLPRGSVSRQSPSIGVVFDPNKNRYKVVRFFHDIVEPEVTAISLEIYSPGDDGWRINDGVVEPPVANLASPLFPTHLSVGGIMYWLAWSEEEEKKGLPDHIIYMDIDEKFNRIRLPEQNLEESSNRSYKHRPFTFLIEYKGRLGVVGVGNDDFEVFIWLLENPEESSWETRKAVVLLTDPEHSIYGINSIVSFENELLFVFSKDIDIFHFLNLDKMFWRFPELAFMCQGCDDGGDILHKLQHRICEPLVFPPFSESLFRCDAAN